MTNSEPQNNPHYEAWAAETGGGPNWEFMGWIARKKKEWLTYCVNHELGVPLLPFTEWVSATSGLKKSEK